MCCSKAVGKVRVRQGWQRKPGIASAMPALALACLTSRHRARQPPANTCGPHSVCLPGTQGWPEVPSFG